jgi:hypothetical protein
MIIHFIASKGNVLQEIEEYRSIVNLIKKRGHTLARDWVEPAYEAALHDPDQRDDDSVDWRRVDQDNLAAISKADLIIVEATKKSFFVGYGVAQAVNQKKPILILTRDNTFPGASQLSASSDIIYSANYTPDTLDGIVSKFLEENTIETKDMRFNFFIDRAIYNYLRWAAFKTGKTKAEILRELVQREIEKKDY